MSHLSDYMQKEKLMKQLQQELLALEESEDLKKDLEFKEQLEMLMKEYEKTDRDVILVCDPYYFEKNQEKGVTQRKQQRKPRKTKVYKNPMTGEMIETKGGNNKILKQWKEEFGEEVVESWLINEDAENQPTPDVTPPMPEEIESKKEESKEENKEEETEETVKEDEEKEGEDKEEK